MENTIWVILTEVLMTLFIIWIISFVKKFNSTINTRSYSFALLVLVMMAGMLDSLTYYLISGKTFLDAIVAVNISMVSMSVAITLIFWVLVSKVHVTYSTKARTNFVLLLLWNEVSMALFLKVIGFPLAHQANIIFYMNFTGLAITSFLFLVPMVAEMIYAIYILMSPGTFKKIVIGLLLMQIADPALIGDSFLVAPLLVVYSGLMLFSIYYVLSHVYKERKNLGQKEGKASINYLIIVGISTAGLIVPVFVDHPFGLGWLAFGISMIAAMALYFDLVLSNPSRLLLSDV